LLVVLVTRDEPESELDFRAWEGVVPRRAWVVLRVLPRRSGALVFFLDGDEEEAEDVVEGAGEEDEPLGREAGVLGGVPGTRGEELVMFSARGAGGLTGFCCLPVLAFLIASLLDYCAEGNGDGGPGLPFLQRSGDTSLIFFLFLARKGNDCVSNEGGSD